MKTPRHLYISTYGAARTVAEVTGDIKETCPSLQQLCELRPFVLIFDATKLTRKSNSLTSDNSH